MQMVPVVSSNLKAVGYDPLSHELRIQFDSGTWIYPNVPQQIFDALMQAPSKGKFLHSAIKPRYPGTKVPPSAAAPAPAPAA